LVASFARAAFERVDLAEFFVGSWRRTFLRRPAQS
jgi:hypothetical protein